MIFAESPFHFDLPWIFNVKIMRVLARGLIIIVPGILVTHSPRPPKFLTHPFSAPLDSQPLDSYLPLSFISRAPILPSLKHPPSLIITNKYYGGKISLIVKRQIMNSLILFTHLFMTIMFHSGCWSLDRLLILYENAYMFTLFWIVSNRQI